MMGVASAGVGVGVWLRPTAMEVEGGNCNNISIPCNCNSTQLNGKKKKNEKSRLHLLCPVVPPTAIAIAAVSSSSSVHSEVAEEEEKEKEKSKRVSSSGAFYVLGGMPQPLGATSNGHGGVNFSLYSSAASAVSLCLFTLADLHQNHITEIIPLHPDSNRTGNVWHLLLCPTSTSTAKLEDMLYGYQLDGQGPFFDPSKVLLDPYAKAVVSRDSYGHVPPTANCWPQMAGMIPPPNADSDFDWQGDRPLGFHQRDLIIYEMHLRGYTKHDSSNVHHPGTFAAATDKLHHLKELGINCIELMPCHEFNELEYFDYSPVMGQHKYVNYAMHRSLQTN